jgi:hypothetical protein
MDTHLPVSAVADGEMSISTHWSHSMSELELEPQPQHKASSSSSNTWPRTIVGLSSTMVQEALVHDAVISDSSDSSASSDSSEEETLPSSFQSSLSPEAHPTLNAPQRATNDSAAILNNTFEGVLP